MGIDEDFDKNRAAIMNSLISSNKELFTAIKLKYSNLSKDALNAMLLFKLTYDIKEIKLLTEVTSEELQSIEELIEI